MNTATTLNPEVPAHVPAHLVWDHSLEAFCHELDDPFVAASRLHDGPDIFWATDSGHGRPGWVMTRHALMREAFVDYAHFTSQGGAGIEQLLGVTWRLIPIDYDPPQHTLYRQILNPFFTPAKVGELDEAVRKVCNSLIEPFANTSACEFVSEFATPFPSYVFLALMGMPIERAPQFVAWERGITHGADFAERQAAARAICSYLEGFLAEQRVNPSTDLMTGVIAARIGGRPLSDDEILGMLYTFYFGGLDTVYSTLGFVLRHLATHPELQARLRDDPEILPKAVDEFLRAFSVVSSRRCVTEDFVFHGVQMKRGDLIVLPLYLAGRDPQVHANPHEIDLERDTGGGQPFATGVHHCLGRHLARREIRIALETLLSRFRNIHLPSGGTYAYHSGVTFGVDRLPLAWEPNT
jgi:cytochrome P450